MTRYARSQGKLYTQREMARMECDDVHSMDPGVEFTVRTMPQKATLELCDRLSNPLIEVDAVVHKDLGYGVAPSTVIDKGTAVEDYTRFEAFSEEGCAGYACTPATHMQSERKTIDEKGEG